MGYGKLRQVAGAYSLTVATPQSIAGQTAVDFTGLSFSQRFHIGFNVVTYGGTSDLVVRLGDASGIIATGYQSCGIVIDAPVSLRRFYIQSTVGFEFNGGVAGRRFSGMWTVSNLDPDNFIYAFSGYGGQTVSPQQIVQVGGNVTLTGPCTQFRVTTINGTDVFSAGTVYLVTE